MDGDSLRRQLLRDARAAAERFPIFPVVPFGKTPAVKRWQERATQDRKVIERWYCRASFNIGLVTGKGLVVVDLDVARGGDGRSSESGELSGREHLARVAYEAGEDYPGDTYTVRTPSGGYHLYFAVSDREVLRNTGGRLAARIDTRANGGYIVAAGSHRRAGMYRVVNRRPIAPLPGWLATALAPTAPAPRPAAVHAVASGNLTGYVTSAINAECATVAAAKTGRRHYALLRAARILGEFVGGGALPEDLARHALTAAAAVHVGVDGCTQAEVDRTIDDGLEYGARRPRRIETRA
ncbi:bifunctional DNA primase/polymerase [Pseudonocardia dioxanivorans]|uniref:bifunctional DNA primase/polymerase n=1 Tax=Pseudonocardia dioxanivorans TaxID=240495 RepID=UPI000CD0BF80|nr:bifunctional DNA primase/polymerase [Pseudonocardia dioxanivorans]